MKLFRRLQYLLNRNRLEEELNNEMEFHREMSEREGGAQFGNALRLREESRDAWGWTWIDRFFQDLRYACRMMAKAPGFTLSAVLMLAIGIGANVAVFGFFDLMVLRPLNVREPETLLRFHRRSPTQYAYSLPYPEAAFFRDHSKTLSAVLALNGTKLSIEGEDKPLNAHFVLPNFFAELGGTPSLGRVLDPEQDKDAVVVLSDGFWRRHFGADPSVIGRTVRLNGKPATVIGVASSEFAGLSFDEPALWAPISQQPYFANGSLLLTDMSVESAGVQMWGRLRPGVSPQAAEEELKSLAVELRKQYPKGIWENENLPSEAGGFAKSMRSVGRRGTGTESSDNMIPLFLLIGALVLLILGVACANLGSLLLARGVARQREISIRVSVGAGTGRLIRQLLTESLLLAILGSGAGLVLGYFTLRSLMNLTGAPVWMNPLPDWRVAAFAIGAGFAAAILFGFAPAWQVARQKHHVGRMRQILVGTQVAASCVLLIVAGLLGRALDHAMTTHPGFEYERVIAIAPGLSQHGYTPARAQVYLDTLQERLRALPGVESVSLALTPPLGNVSISAGLTVDGRALGVEMNHVDPSFFQTMRIPLIRGRNLARGEKHVVIISESLARAAWAGQDPLGKKFNVGEDYTVVGIAGNARLTKMEDSDSVESYMPIEESEMPMMYVLVKASGRAEDLARSVTTTARGIDPGTIPEVQLVRSGFERKLENAQKSALAVSLLGSIAHLLACLGIVGVVAYAVSQRTKEIGIRMALGAKPGQVISVVLRQFSRPVLIGMVVGIGAAAAMSKVMRGVLYGISNLDPATYAITIGVFVITVALAALLPARRALRVDPLEALRHE